jgi:hypothetical protein
MSDTSRVALKLVWMAVLVVLIVLLGQVQHDFIYQGF